MLLAALLVIATGLGTGARSAAAADRALLVGIDLYADPGLNLSGSAEDVVLMQAMLRDQFGFEAGSIRTLLDTQATRENILREIRDWLIAGSGPGDHLFFHYSGHGYYAIDDGDDETDGFDEVLVPHDAELVDSTAHPDRYDRIIRDDRIRELFAGLDDRRVTLVFDSCHSGTMSRSVAGTGAPHNMVRTPRVGQQPAGSRAVGEAAVRSHQRERTFLETDGNMVVWSAVSSTQLALIDFEVDPPRRGVFTGLFTSALRDGSADRNRNGRTSHAELLDYLREKSEDYCERNQYQCKHGLTPSLEAPRAAYLQDVVSGTAPQQTGEVAGDGLGHGNVAGLRLAMQPGTDLTVDEPLAVSVESPVEGHLLLIDIDAAGQVTQIFPNKFAERAGQGVRIGAGQTIAVPDARYGFKFRAKEPAGDGLLIAIVAEDPVVLDDLTAGNRVLSVVANSNDYLAALAERLRGTWTEALISRRIRWSMAELRYQIRRP